MKTIYPLKYGLNPYQASAGIVLEPGQRLPFNVLNGTPSYINFLDALNAFQLVNELKRETGQVAAASFKHVSPAGVAFGYPLTLEDKRAFRMDEGKEYNALSCSYLRARHCDPVSSFGEFIALNGIVDVETARIIAGEVADGIIAPGFEDEALEILKKKRKGNFLILEMDENHTTSSLENRDVFGVRFQQERNNRSIDRSILKNSVTGVNDISDTIARDAILAMITLKYTQSNSTCFVYNGQTIGVGAGQQSRIHCTRISASKAEGWLLRRHPHFVRTQFKEGLSRTELYNAMDLCLNYNTITDFEKKHLTSLVNSETPQLTELEKKEWIDRFKDTLYASDGFIPFRDNIDRAAASGAKIIVQPGGSIRDQDVIDAAKERGITMIFTGTRLFTH